MLYCENAYQKVQETYNYFYEGTEPLSQRRLGIIQRASQHGIEVGYYGLGHMTNQQMALMITGIFLKVDISGMNPRRYVTTSIKQEMARIISGKQGNSCLIEKEIGLSNLFSGR